MKSNTTHQHDRRTGLTAALFILVALASACASANAQDTSSSVADARSVYNEVTRSIDDLTPVLEAKAVRCMAEQGFDYVPFDSYEDPSSSDTPLVDGLLIDMGIMEDPTPVDPNQAYVDGLADTDKSLYRGALHGTENLSSDRSIGDHDYGCLVSSGIEVLGEDRIQAIVELEDSIVELDQRISADPRVLTAREKVSDCAAREGFSANDVVARIISLFGVSNPIEIRGLDPDVVESLADPARELELESRAIYRSCSEDVSQIERQVEAELASEFYADLGSLQDITSVLEIDAGEGS